MSLRDQIFGLFLSAIAVLIAIIWFYVLYTGGDVLLALEIVVSVILLTIVVILFWIGYTIATTPSIEEIERGRRRR